MAQSNATTNGKSEYSCPRLVVYGEFANLTAGGVGSTVEIGNRRAKRRP